uniref:Uncharacterized protein n=1 Tax=Steinernema glaseri TaxID=37863 RepID=A0A1I7YT74_9BILA
MKGEGGEMHLRTFIERTTSVTTNELLLSYTAPQKNLLVVNSQTLEFPRIRRLFECLERLFFSITVYSSPPPPVERKSSSETRRFRLRISACTEDATSAATRGPSPKSAGEELSAIVCCCLVDVEEFGPGDELSCRVASGEAKQEICGCVCVGIGIWLVLDKYAVDNLAFATSKVKGYEKDDGLRDLENCVHNNAQGRYLQNLPGGACAWRKPSLSTKLP